MDYESKILLLEDIIIRDSKCFLKVVLDYKGHSEILWEIDIFTGNLLKSLIEFDEKNKYRLSFYTPYTPGNEKKLCFVTKTYRGESEPIYFLASDSFIKQLMSIKECKDIKELDRRIFILDPSKKLMKRLEDGEEPSDNRFFRRNKQKFGLVSLPLFSIGILLIIGYLVGYYQRDIRIEEKVSAAPIDNVFALENRDQGMDENFLEVIEEEKIEVEDIINRDYYELESTVNFRLPEGKVALTFDDGPSKYTNEIVDILKDYNIPGTFFFVGRQIPKFSEEVEYTHDSGYAIGSHSVTHAQFTKISEAKRQAEVFESMSAIEEITGEKPVLFRPPYGSYNKATENLIANNNYKIVLWNIDTRDWEVRNEDKILENIKNKEASGSIILLHEIEPTVNVLPRIIEYLQSLDLEIVNLK